MDALARRQTYESAHLRDARFAQPTLSEDVRALRTELHTTGIDEYLQGIGDDPFGSLAADGLRIPAFKNSPKTRYLFQCVTLPVARGMRIRILGRRQLLSMATVQTPRDAAARVDEFRIKDPSFRLQDANVSWHLMRIRPRGTRAPYRDTNSDNFVYRYATTGSALLYETFTCPPANVNPFGKPDFYTTLTAYTPPNGGRPYGEPLLSTWHNVRNPWNEPHSADWTGIEVDGPCIVVDFASVLQTQNGGVALTQNVNPNSLNSLGSDEEAFLAEWAGAVKLWRVGSAIQYEVL